MKIMTWFVKNLIANPLFKDAYHLYKTHLSTFWSIFLVPDNLEPSDFVPD